MKFRRAIIILMNGLQSNSVLSQSSELRLKKAIDLYTGDELLVLTTGFTINKPPFFKNNYPVYESYVGAQYLVNKGIPKYHILTERYSSDTIGNVYFTKIIHIDVLSIEHITVITSLFHLERTRLLFEWIYSLTGEMTRTNYQLFYIGSDNPNYDSDTYEDILKREKGSAKRIARNSSKISSQEDFHYWLFNEHDAYTFDKKITPLTGKIKKAY